MRNLESGWRDSDPHNQLLELVLYQLSYKRRITLSRNGRRCWSRCVSGGNLGIRMIECFADVKRLLVVGFRPSHHHKCLVIPFQEFMWNMSKEFPRDNKSDRASEPAFCLYPQLCHGSRPNRRSDLVEVLLVVINACSFDKTDPVRA